MKKYFILVFSIIFSLILGGCKSFDKYSIEEEKTLGLNLISKVFLNPVYSSMLNIGSSHSTFALTWDYAKEKNALNLKDIFSDSKKNYYFYQDIVTIYDNLEREIDSFSLSREEFLNLYAG